jgi:type IV secretory pathway VirB3-like protein
MILAVLKEIEVVVKGSIKSVLQAGMAMEDAIIVIIITTIVYLVIPAWYPLVC